MEEFKINKDQKKVMKRFRKYLSGEYEQNLEKNKINEDKKPAITETDIVYQKIDKILMDYIKQEKYLEIINKHINIIDKNLIIEKTKQSHVRKNKNNKFKFDYSIDFIFVIRKIIESFVEKNKIQFNHMMLSNKIYSIISSNSIIPKMKFWNFSQKLDTLIL